MIFQDLNLHNKLLQALKKCGFETPTEIQEKAIPIALEGHDIMASAQTGTGKTAAFMLPLMHQILESEEREFGPRILVLSPTRELAIQIQESAKMLSKNCKMFIECVMGGEPIGKEARVLKRPIDVLVATPGRLLDHLQRGRLDLSTLEALVIDEADRMLDMGFIDDVKMIIEKTPDSRQTLLFSATLEGKVLKSAKGWLNNPVRVQVAQKQVCHSAITQQLHMADDMNHKHELLAHYLEEQEINQAVIFTATKSNADTLARALKEDGHRATALHGDMSQFVRKRTIEKMRRGKLQLLVATDVAARGLDINGISHVFNFDLPMQAEDYVHRIGRTGRGGATGTAISFVSQKDRFVLGMIEKLTGESIKHDVIPGLEAKKVNLKAPAKNKSRRRNDRSRSARFGASWKGDKSRRSGGRSNSEGRFSSEKRSESGSRFGSDKRSESRNRFSSEKKSDSGSRFGGEKRAGSGKRFGSDKKPGSGKRFGSGEGRGGFSRARAGSKRG